MELLDYVSVLHGTDNNPRFSNGNVLPIVAHPHGMSGFTMQTDGGAGNWFFSPRDRTFEGVRLTHQPSPWVGDYGHILFMPSSGNTVESASNYSTFRPENRMFTPYYLGLDLLRFRTKVEVTATERGGMIRQTNSSGNKTVFSILPYAKSDFKLSGNVITGFTESQSVWGFEDLKEYFYIQFDCDVEHCESVGENGGLMVFLSANQVTTKIAASYISAAQAKLNFNQEMGLSFDDNKKLLKQIWEDKLRHIEVSGESEERCRIFYSCLYRAMLFPRKFHEIDAQGNIVHYNPDTRKVSPGVFYTDNGFWDTYRTVYPLLSIIEPKTVAEMCEGFVNFYEETGYLPKWLSPGEFGLMPGTLVEAVLADAAVKGILPDKLLRRAYAGMLKNAYVDSGNAKQGRHGCSDYLKFGYVPNTHHECVNHTLDCAYGDFCIGEVAKLLEDEIKHRELKKRSLNYKNIFDGKTGFMRGKDEKGEMKKDFSPIDWGGENCEGSSYQNSFAVYHDIEGLAALYGGKEKLKAKLDELFVTPPHFNVGGYGREIHEMSEMAAVDFGQCAISNQPSFHLPYIYGELGYRAETEYWTQKLADGAFTSQDDGLPGDEDNGTMAAWYIFTAMGFYPLCPGKDRYVLSKPLFKQIRINGKKLPMFDGNFVTHDQLKKL